ncbi:restriction endonuclease subunit S [Wielerella bovis]|uniref:restriction endonuclease subunit S n=1 Tax=Wielerella bovis TaxID=2917790 RepID=UPI00201A0AB7|nr:restriction endonuclease subunit S [Wielerella bovis]MCG7657535.1 restriction endonuclease subunit S [Wielerella bovis]MCG7659756.1 restriction endonuclease subunit S [Wielerella bovis]
MKFEKLSYPADWGVFSLQEVCSCITSGGTPSRKNEDFYKNGSVCWVKTKELENYYIYDTEEKITSDAIKNSSAKILPQNTILLAMYGATVGELGILSKDMACNQACCALIVNSDQFDYRYVFYLLKLHKKEIQSLATGAAQQNLSATVIRDFTFGFPILEKQKNIANILECLDKKIQLNTQTNQTLEAIAQAIFKSWFVDFDPVRAKAQAISDGKTSDEANLSAMAVISGKAVEDLSQTEYQQLWEIADAFPSELVENAEFGEAPKGWEILSVGDVATITKGKSYKSSELEPSSTALVTLKSFNRGGGYRLDGLKEYSGTYKAEQEVFAGDLIVAYTDVTQAADVIGKPAMVMSDSRYEHLVISLDVGVVRPKNEKFKYFLYCLAMTDLFQNHTKSFCTGTTVLHLAKEAVPSFEFIKPNDNLIDLFDNLVSSMFIKINGHIEENKNLEKTRDLLLPKLLSGELFNE